MRLELITLLDDDIQSIVWCIYIQELRTRRFHRFLSDTAVIDTCNVFNIDEHVRPTMVTLWDARCWVFRRQSYGVSSYITYRRAIGHASHEFSRFCGFLDDETHWVREVYRRSAADDAHPAWMHYNKEP